MPELSIEKYAQKIHYFTEPLIFPLKPINMVLIPGGTFQMGSPETELDRNDNESPQHSVTVQPFFMSEYPIAQAHWSLVAQMPQVEIELSSSPSHFKGNERPVENVSWFEAVEFCKRLSNHSKRTYRLPTEAEWEYACRANSQTPFHYGETITTDLADYRATDDGNLQWSGSYGRGIKGIYRQETTPVGTFSANAFGLYDMHGNVWEWCQDHWHDNYQGAPTDGSAWIDKEDNNRRVQRGGSWDNYPRSCRSATRLTHFHDYRINSFGFRVVCEIPKTV